METTHVFVLKLANKGILMEEIWKLIFFQKKYFVTYIREFGEKNSQYKGVDSDVHNNV